MNISLNRRQEQETNEHDIRSLHYGRKDMEQLHSSSGSDL